jgi:hypothetical protein
MPLRYGMIGCLLILLIFLQRYFEEIKSSTATTTLSSLDFSSFSLNLLLAILMLENYFTYGYQCLYATAF